MSGLLEFCLNPTFGKLSDRIGRRPFFLVGPAYVFLGNAVLAAFAKNLSPSMLPLILVNSLLRKVAATVSGSVASVTALSDVSQDVPFAINISKTLGTCFVRVRVFVHIITHSQPNRLTLSRCCMRTIHQRILGKCVRSSRCVRCCIFGWSHSIDSQLSLYFRDQEEESDGKK